MQIDGLIGKKGKVNFKIYDVTSSLINYCNTHIEQYFEKYRQSGNENAWQTFFLEIYTQNVVEKLFPDPFPKTQNWAYL